MLKLYWYKIQYLICIQIFQEVVDREGQRCTPLIVAARNGHEKVIKVLLSKFSPDIEQEGSVKVDSYIIEGASALWCASGKICSLGDSLKSCYALYRVFPDEVMWREFKEDFVFSLCEMLSRGLRMLVQSRSWPMEEWKGC